MRLLLTAATLSLALAPSLAHADEGALLIGVGGGIFNTDPLEALDTTWTVVPRIGWEFRENAIAELDLAIAMGDTRGQKVSYTALSPTLNFRGIFIDQLPRKNEDGETIGTRVSPVQPYLSIGAGVIYKNVSDPDALSYEIPNPDVDFIAKAGPGVQFPLGSVMMLRTDYKVVGNFGTERFNGHGDALIDWEWTVGLDFIIGGGRDSDDDGIADSRDTCPTEPEDLDMFQDEDGCPDTDNDEDGLLDSVDQCPDQGEDLDEYMDEDGCPDPDNDEDGILDADDECPLEAGMASANGCPDRDEDGITDAFDACPDHFGPEETQGCPDTDGDGVFDPEDECVDEVGPVDAYGCPDSDEDTVPTYRDDCPDEPANEGIDGKRSDGCPARVFIAIDGIKITEKVFFDSGRATIQRRSYSLLDDVAAIMNAYPEITKVEVQGHTDSQGAEDANLTLSQNRASAVVLYLSEHGVEPGRMVAQGYGESQPIADNDTREGRADNRRVEFKILEQEVRVEEVREDAIPEGSTVIEVDSDLEEEELEEVIEDVIESVDDSAE